MASSCGGVLSSELARLVKISLLIWAKADRSEVAGELAMGVNPAQVARASDPILIPREARITRACRHRRPDRQQERYTCVMDTSISSVATSFSRSALQRGSRQRGRNKAAHGTDSKPATQH